MDPFETKIESPSVVDRTIHNTHLSSTNKLFTMDLEYANKQIDTITEQAYSAKKLCVVLEDQDRITEDSYQLLQTLYDRTNKSIEDYYKYLRTVDVDPRDSYITAWLRDEGTDILEHVEEVLDSKKDNITRGINFDLIFDMQRHVRDVYRNMMDIYATVKWEESITAKQHEDLKICCENTYTAEGNYREYLFKNLHKDDREEFLNYVKGLGDETDKVHEFLSKVSLKSSE